uniref:F-box domain-containing protein n=2 Tax=Davidia involucrata TaxID=16924 RepID=A0A5B7AJF3_DAVIN
MKTVSSIIPMSLVNLLVDDPQPKPKGRVREQNPDLCMMEINGIGCLPRDLIIEILSRLPVKVLCNFKCVSKQWLNTISNDTCLLSRHRERSKRNPLLHFREYSSGEAIEGNKQKVMVALTSIDMDGTLVNKISVPTGGPVYTFTSCGHLIVLCCTYRVYVCNPSTREFARVPRSASVARYQSAGFGCVCASGVYKIVHLFLGDHPIGRGEEMGCEIFTLTHGGGVDSASWRRISDCPYRVCTDRPPVSVNGVIYWMMMMSCESIVFFDLEKEEFGKISHPKFNFWFLTGLKGSLCLVDCSTTPSIMDVWMLKDCRDSIWVKEYSISLFPCEIRSVVPYDDNNGEIFLVSEQKGLICHNIDNKTFRVSENSGLMERYKMPCLYYGSFFSL